MGKHRGVTLGGGRGEGGGGEEGRRDRKVGNDDTTVQESIIDLSIIVTCYMHVQLYMYNK